MIEGGNREELGGLFWLKLGVERARPGDKNKKHMRRKPWKENKQQKVNLKSDDCKRGKWAKERNRE
jgi:hypothetical protein